MAINYNKKIEEAKNEWRKAKARGDKAAMDRAHQKAENARKAMGYSGGSDGSQKIKIDKDTSKKYREAYERAENERHFVGAKSPLDPYYVKSIAEREFDKYANNIRDKVKSGKWDGDSNYSGYTGGSSSKGGSSSSKTSKTYMPSSSRPSYVSKYDIQKDIQKEIERLAKIQRQQAIAQLEKAKDAALSNLQSEKSGIQPRYFNARNQANVQNKLAAKSLAEYMAQRGLTNSGENTQAQLMQNVALQGALGNLSQQEQMALDDIARRQTGLENAYESDKAAAEAGVNAQMLQNKIAAMQSEQLRQDQLRQQEIENAYRQAGLDFQLRQYEDSLSRMNDPNNIENQIKQAELARLMLQNQYYPKQIESQLASQNALTQQRLTPKTSNRTKYTKTDINTAVKNIRRQIDALIDKTGKMPSYNDIVQFANEFYGDYPQEVVKQMIRELQGYYGIGYSGASQNNTSQNNVLRGPINPQLIMNLMPDPYRYFR